MCWRPSPPTSVRKRTKRSCARPRRPRSRRATVCVVRWISSMASVAKPAAGGTTARLGGVLALVERSERFAELVERLEGRATLTVAEASAGARAFAWSALVDVARRPLVLVAPSEDRARRWRAELAAWLGEERVLAFPERETMPYELGSSSPGAVHQRLLTLWRMHTATEPVAVVVSLRALMEHTIAPEDLRRRGRTLRAHDRVDWNATAAWLFDLGYEPVAEVSEPGTFSRRGGILDVYPASASMPVRVELFGDEIETLRSFDPVTQRSQDALESVDVLPAREYSLERAAEVARSSEYSRAGSTSTDSSASCERCVTGSKERSVSISSPKSSTRTGIEALAG